MLFVYILIETLCLYGKVYSLFKQWKVSESRMINFLRKWFGTLLRYLGPANYTHGSFKGRYNCVNYACLKSTNSAHVNG